MHVRDRMKQGAKEHWAEEGEQQCGHSRRKPEPQNSRCFLSGQFSDTKIVILTWSTYNLTCLHRDYTWMFSPFPSLWGGVHTHVPWLAGAGHRTTCKVRSLLPPCGFWGSGSGKHPHQLSHFAGSSIFRVSFRFTEKLKARKTHRPCPFSSYLVLNGAINRTAHFLQVN